MEDIPDTNKSTLTHEDSKTTAPPEPEKKTNPSQRQLDHLRYAREMKKLKQATRDHENEVNNRNLDLIYKRLTNIENQISNVQQTQTTGIKRSRSRSVKADASDSDDYNANPKSRKIKETSEGKENPSFFYNSVVPYAGRTIFLGASAFVISLLKNYATNYRSTSDKDDVGGFYYG